MPADARGHDRAVMTCKRIAIAMGIELAPPAKIERVVRFRPHHLSDHGWVTRTEAGWFMPADG
ncbi:hypothetical protein [Streptomyces sp. HJ7]